MTDSTFEAFQAELFEAATGEKSFAEVLSGMAARFSAVDGVIFELNRATGEMRNWTSPTMPQNENDGYSQHINAINPRMHYAMAHAAGQPVYEGRFISEGQIARNEFYDWLKRGYDMKFFLGTRLYDDGDISVFNSVEFSADREHPEPDRIAAFARASHALGNAWLLAGRGARSPADHQFAPNHLPYAIFALDGRGQVVEANDAARALLSEGALLRIDRRSLFPVFRPMQAPFGAMLSKALAGNRTEMLLHGRPGAGETILQAVPVAERPRRGPSDVVAVLYLWTPSAPFGDRIETARRLWGLSPAETLLIAHLAEGASLEESAEALQIARNTARNHLSRIFAKTGVARQSELMRLVQAVLPGG
ncbi:MAG: helix-turn-helix transcriptional regulator [Silicimonas sp.]|nr:helix-turn-helix transcriptional regulator [Silicimonas sp.]